MRRARREAGVESLVTRCAVLLRGGVQPAQVFGIIARESGEAAAIAERIAEGAPIAQAIADENRPEWRVVATAWRLAERSGSALAPALERIATSLQQLAELRDRRSVLLSGPRATFRLVAALPPLALMLGSLLGFDPWPVLLSPFGALMLVAGVGMLALGAVWARALGRAAEEGDGVAGLELELAWIALGGGAAPSEALVRVVDCVDEMRAEWVGFRGFLSEGPLRTAVSTAASTGVPVRPLLLQEAAASRARAHAELERSAERLGVRVLLPLGVCVLPAFVLLGVLPVLFSMIEVF